MVGDETFWNAMKVTLQYVAINIVVQTVLAVLIAVLLQRVTRSVFVRSVVVLPFLISNVVVRAALLLDARRADRDRERRDHRPGARRDPLLRRAGLGGATIALVNVWRHMGYTALLVFAGLMTIPEGLYEAGRVDGASEWRMFWSITLPLLRPVLALVLVITVTGSFRCSTPSPSPPPEGRETRAG